MESTFPCYMDFEPYCAWLREEGNDVLAVHLHGFRKEEVGVQVNSQRMLTIHGQRRLDETKWSRFRKQIKLGDDCIENGIRAKFAGGILTITIPRRTSSSPHRPEQTCTGKADTIKLQVKDAKKWVLGKLMWNIAAVLLVLAVSGAYVNCLYKQRSCVQS